MNWKQDQIDWLCINSSNYGSYAKLARAFNEVFHTDFSRCALTGKVSRMGLSGPPKLPIKGVVNRGLKRRDLTGRQPRRSQYVAEVIVSPLTNSRNDCAWPLQDKPCISKACVGPYCEQHALLAYKKMPDDSRIRKTLYQMQMVHNDAKLVEEILDADKAPVEASFDNVDDMMLWLND